MPSKRGRREDLPDGSIRLIGPTKKQLGSAFREAAVRAGLDASTAVAAGQVADWIGFYAPNGKGEYRGISWVFVTNDGVLAIRIHPRPLAEVLRPALAALVFADPVGPPPSAVEA